ncbi:putative peptidyl-prolyl cis-trans isomerase-like 4-like [Apostichopus japonicus]|uniref:Peptidyl-prolyl cis-trans isomerase n=1 Tax=Stichopus japonicus TaxID=307972 RepID=A0A2G8KXQ4_STIJA|nr:putative peptidyl-prolyl cis-trans isomerase-like 4-like [Apostichopus japonicus]
MAPRGLGESSMPLRRISQFFLAKCTQSIRTILHAMRDSFLRLRLCVIHSCFDRAGLCEAYVERGGIYNSRSISYLYVGRLDHVAEQTQHSPRSIYITTGFSLVYVRKVAQFELKLTNALFTVTSHVPLAFDRGAFSQGGSFENRFLKMAVLLETTMGDIVVDLYPEERPRCCLNFLKLCKMKYYNFNIFHSVQRSFMAQTGDPSGTGTGGQSVFGHMQGEKARFFEMESHPRIKHKKKGSISMVNNGSNQHGSQFFITLREDIDYLDGIHTVFGVVTEGFDVLDKISETFCDAKHRPLQDIRINHTVILDDPFDDPEGLELPDKSPEIDPYKLKSDRIAADEDIGKEKEKTTEQVEEETQTQEARLMHKS